MGKRRELAALDPARAARMAHLRYVHDEAPGLRRHRAGRGFRYVDAAGRAVRDQAVLARIRSLAIPPAWRDVWICPDENGHIQATGRDARGRMQYRYHPAWRELRDATKFAKLAAFGAALPRIRKAVERDLARDGLPREKVIATVVKLLEATLIRVGNEEYARANRSFGLSTLRDRHVVVSGSELRFRFRGKSGKEHDVSIHDRRLARIVREVSELPGHELFQYVADDGTRHSVESGDVNAYLREVAGDEFTAKDFRTWAGTMLAATELAGASLDGDSQAARKRALDAVVGSVAERLGNTRAVCRRCYIHPSVMSAFMDGTLAAPRDEKALVALIEHTQAAA
ncbi:MAG: DNA topoisomerase IB [Myxococcota bacterium]